MRGRPSGIAGGLIALAGVILIAGCATTTGVPKGIEPVSGFEPDRYLGRWYEVARLDHSFERGLTNVTASYSLRDDGGITVVNRGFNPKSGEWKRAEGRAYFRGDRDTASLKVSFFGPFYGGYHVFALDKEEYRWAMVAGPSRDYLWILARSPELDPAVYERLVEQAAAQGFPVDELIRVPHSRAETGET